MAVANAVSPYNAFGGIWTLLFVPVWSVKLNKSVWFNVILIRFLVIVVLIVLEVPVCVVYVGVLIPDGNLYKCSLCYKHLNLMYKYVDT